ncbi:hypothetical protein LTR97_007520 [Elasticomyces elasticus]|uniref:Pentacotripeptide-repeat region of PRORP domain-containing protein n=1 Tax=Elasticomyces elasticus TaxID=574655 RepID=A0AAN7W4Z8_9PEZI|nr:hypothetical protein LTR97_007520 [Elasticomyces elasticus]
MPLCSTLIRSALHSWSARRLTYNNATSNLRRSQWHINHSLQRTYTTVLAEPRQDEKPAAQAADAAYLDFLYGEDANVSSPEIEKSAPSGVGVRKQQHARIMQPIFAGQKGQRTKRPTKPVVRARMSPLPSTRRWERGRPYAQMSPKMRALAKARSKAAQHSKHLGPKKNSIRSDLRSSAVFSSSWNIKYTGLARRYDRALSEHYLEPPTAVALPIDAFERIEEIMDYMKTMRHGSVFNLKALAQRYGKIEREVWSETALWLICYDKIGLMDFLLATHTALYPPINWVEDCLQVLARHFSISGETRSIRFSQLIQTFLILLDRETRERFVFHSSFADEIWSNIKLGKVKVHSNTILHFARYFVDNDQLERSLDALLEAHKAGAPTSSVAFRSACSTLLRRSSSHPGGFRLCLRLVEHLGNLGVLLDTRMYNIVLLNAVEAGDLETANSLYGTMLGQGLSPDKYTCAIRLKACKQDIDNAALLRDVIQDAIQYGEVRTNEIVSSEVLHCLALHHVKHNPQTAFATLAAAYIQFFEPASLERLGLRFPSQQQPADVGIQRMQPPKHAITYLLSVYLDHNASSDEAIDLYARWRTLVEAGDPVLAGCATTPHLCNIFLQRFTHIKRTLLNAAQVVKDMQKPLPASAGIEQAQPTLHTWSIFMHGFAQRGETKLAEQVLGYMRSKGMEPDHVAWSTLINAYGTGQDGEGLLDVIRRAEASGDVWSEWSQKGVRRFEDKARLRQLLEQQGFERRMDFTRDIKEKVFEKVSGEADEESTDERIAMQRFQDGEVEGVAHRRSSKRPRDGFADSSAELAEMAGSFRQT